MSRGLRVAGERGLDEAKLAHFFTIEGAVDVDVDDVIHVNGMYRHGFLMAPALALDLVSVLAKEPAHAH